MSGYAVMGPQRNNWRHSTILQLENFTFGVSSETSMSTSVVDVRSYRVTTIWRSVYLKQVEPFIGNGMVVAKCLFIVYFEFINL